MAAARFRRIAFAATVVLGCGLVTTTGAATDAGAAPADPVRVTVNTRAGLATMPDTGLGLNHAVWDSQLGTPEVADLLGAAGVRMLRYPGGSYGDIYHWET